MYVVYTGTATFIKSLFRYLFRLLLLLFKSDCSVNFVAYCWDQTFKMLVIPLFLKFILLFFRKTYIFMQKSTLILEFVILLFH